MKKLQPFALCYLFLLLFLNFSVVAQTDTTLRKTSYFAEAGGMAASNSRTPFWLRANQFGTVPLENPFAFVKLGGQTTFGTDSRKPQLHLQAELVANASKTFNVLLPTAAATLRFRKFEIYAGRRKEFFGLGDTLLTSGSYSWSGNALPLPKIQIGTRGFVPISFTKGLIAFQVTYSHGWFGSQDSSLKSYLHQKSLYVRIGKSKVKFFAGIIHNVQWGGRARFLSKSLSSNGLYPSSFKDYLYLIVAKPPQGANYSSHDLMNQLGNHLGSIDFAVEINSNIKWDVLLYHQHPYEDKSGLVFINFPDGLYGIRLNNKSKVSASFFHLEHFTLEYLTTMDKGGNIREDLLNRYEPDTYFNHGQYTGGWSYQQYVIGTPFITRYMDTRKELIDPRYLTKSLRHNIISNNTVTMLYLGLQGKFRNLIKAETKLAFSQNFPQYFRKISNQANQFSGFFQLSFPYPKKGMELKTAISADFGNLYSSNVGGMISLRKTW
ncbi:hypothetical protein GVN20_25975 [Runella sp. CRIBMP]|uniref:capsule assembly Wzi family protein n=1 Tax=Runella sp. CRIBMP TaxID=2683261 RepID=UPI0014123E8F|nr:capsule assembly Wzi family protein [Runella sp. CRIBMP]NBB22831.1 hypothetical protein [Runella sp. CRIBMP]